MSDLQLPADLQSFLKHSSELVYDVDSSDVGPTSLFALRDLRLQRFPVETSSQPFWNEDPNNPGVNSYLVLAVDLVASCEEYNPAGLLLWLPIEKRYACWDESHCTMEMFMPETVWSMIEENPLWYLEASCGGDDVVTETLIPWNDHPYGNAQVYTPQSA